MGGGGNLQSRRHGGHKEEESKGRGRRLSGGGGQEGGWNWLDLIVVSVSVTTLFVKDSAGYDVFRLFRMFRLVRILHRFKKLNRLINAISSSILPVCNTLAVLLIITAVYALVGVDLWGIRDPEGFGRFTTAFLTMLQVPVRPLPPPFLPSTRNPQPSTRNPPPLTA
eukprot:2848985-Rhodomonas_salina.3